MILITAATFGLYWAYLLQSRTQAATSDSAGQVLQGWAMVHGNWLLSGWYVSDVSFWTFEVPVDGLVAAVDGLRADVTHVAAAIEYALLVLFAALLAAGAARDRRFGGREGLIRGLVAAGVMVTPGTWEGSGVLLGAPDHIGVGVPVLITLLTVDRLRPRRWRLAGATVVGAGLLLVWAQLDDPVATFSCALPLAVVCGLPAAAAGFAAIVRALVGGVRRRRGRTVADPPRPRRRGAGAPGYDAALAVVAAASYGLTQLLVRVIWHSGGYYQHSIQGGSQLSGWTQVSTQIQAEAENALILFGANFWVRPQPQTAFAYLHLVCLAVALLGLLLAIAFWRRGDLVTRTLVVGVLIMLVAGAFSPLMLPLGGTHEIAIVLPFGAVLGGRLIGPWLAARRAPRAGWFARSVPVVRLAAGCALAAAGLALLAGLGYAAAQPGAAPRDQALANWLLAHKLTSGLSGYWQANITTLQTGGKVRLAPLTSAGKYGYLWESKAEWFNPEVSSANFIVATTQQTGGSGVTAAEALAWYAKPAKIYRFQQFSILVYHRNLLATVVQPTPSQLYAPPDLDGAGLTTGEVPAPFIGVRNGGL
ncbi:MAG: hypothetical protein ABSA02_32175 [Trebonia sp.]